MYNNVVIEIILIYILITDIEITTKLEICFSNNIYAKAELYIV